MQIMNQTLTTNHQDFQVTAYWLDSNQDFNNTRHQPVVIICPGGGFRYHSQRETEPIALKALAEGCHAVVLPYQLIEPDQMVYPTALQQLAKTIEWVTDQSDTQKVDSERIVLVGFSAGGHLVATFNGIATNPELNTQYQLDSYRGHHAAVILSYPVIDLDAGFPKEESEKERITTDQRLWHAQDTLTKWAKPCFVWQTATDELVPAINSLLYVTELNRLNITTEYHLFSDGVHGLALANKVTQRPGKPQDVNEPVAQWLPLALTWLAEIDIAHR